MAQAKQPKIVPESLQPKDTIAGYRFTWQEGALIAYAELMPIQDQPARGFLLECNYTHEQPGRRLSDRMIDTGTTLTSKVRELMTGQMLLAGWREIGQDEKRRPIWQHSSRIASSAPAPAPATRTRRTRRADLQVEQVAPAGEKQARRTLYVPAHAPEEGRKIKDYHRTITASDVTFTCSRCGDQVTKALFPGATPQYCDDCATEVKREKTRARVQRLRAGKKHAS